MVRLLFYSIWILLSLSSVFAAESDFCSVCRLQNHTGHRGGGDPKFCSYPENSLTALKSFAICGDDSLKTYLEFDVNSTRDGELVVFHGPQLKKMIYFEDNKQVLAEVGVTTEKQFKKLNTYDLDYSVLRKLKLVGIGQEHIPTLDEYLLAYSQFGLRYLIIPDLKFVDANYIDLLFDKLHDFQLVHQIIVQPYATNFRWAKLGEQGRNRVCQNFIKYSNSFDTSDFKNRCDLQL